MSAATATNLISGHEMLAAITRHRARVTVRLARPGEQFPTAWELGFDQLGSLDPNWLWIAERINPSLSLQQRGVGPDILGALIASEAHGIAVIWRIVSQGGPEAALVTRRLLHTFLRDLPKRGLQGYLTMLNLDVPTQASLARIIERAGGHRSPVANLTIMAGPIPPEAITCHS